MISDVDRIMDVMAVSFDPHYREAWTHRQVSDSLATPSTFMLLVNNAGNDPAPEEDAAGFVLARQAADEVELLLIAVRPENRGSGIGRKLLETFLDASRTRGATKVFLEMRDGNPARALYERFGFEQIGVRRDYYRTVLGTAIDAHTFAREL